MLVLCCSWIFSRVWLWTNILNDTISVSSLWTQWCHNSVKLLSEFKSFKDIFHKATQCSAASMLYNRMQIKPCTCFAFEATALLCCTIISIAICSELYPLLPYCICIQRCTLFTTCWICMGRMNYRAHWSQDFMVLLKHVLSGLNIKSPTLKKKCILHSHTQHLNNASITQTVGGARVQYNALLKNKQTLKPA